jgi:hypothetical protein
MPLVGGARPQLARLPNERRVLTVICCLLLPAVCCWPSAASALPVGQQLQNGGVGTRLGTHILLEVTAAPFERLNSSQMVLAAMHAAIEAGGLTVVGELAHQFPVMGFSAVLMIRCVNTRARVARLATSWC